MAEINILFQGLREENDHDTAVNSLLLLSDIEHYLFSLAFVRRNGVERIQENLRNVSDKVEIFIGIRNGITSIQSIFSLFKIGIKPYVVDTASNSRIFHPKIYAAYNESNAHIILGSANLTYGGLNENIEASSYMILNREDQKDENYLSDLIQAITSLPTVYSDHVFKINNPKQAVQLLREGRLEDERLTRLPFTNKVQKNKERDKLLPIPTYRRKKKILHKVTKKKKLKTLSNTGIFVWESKLLKESNLNIPKGKNTNKTGHINLGAGLMKGLDFQNYFRDTVFSELIWSTNPKRSPHLERARIDIEIIIKSISYGSYNLEVTHDPRTNTRSYEENNVMTKIKWGDAISLIAKKDLVGRSLKLYKNSPSDFVIVID